MAKLIDLTGMAFGRWEVLGRASQQSEKARWICKCACGKEKIVLGESLRNGKSTSCGCYRKEKTKSTKQKHGYSSSRLYKIWSSMCYRCASAKSMNYKYYGGSGISVCEEWKEFDNFRNWSYENGYNDTLSIDRIDSDKGYCPSNCRWVTTRDQMLNKKCVRKITYHGNVYTVRDIAEMKNISYSTLSKGICKGKIAIDGILSDSLPEADD